MMKPYYQDELATIYHGDCREIVPMLGKRGFDAVVTDPPYGVNFVHGGGGGGIVSQGKSKPIFGDDKAFDPAWLVELGGKSKAKKGKFLTQATPVLIFGANHFPVSEFSNGQWLVWDKSCGQGPNASFVDAEFAWMNRRSARCIYRHFWMGIMRAGMDNPSKSARCHPSQKPVELMMWCIETARIGLGKTVLDPYMGSGSTGVACRLNGRKFIGIELDEQYCEIAAKRLREVGGEDD